MLRLRVERFDTKALDKGYPEEINRESILELVVAFENRQTLVDVLAQVLGMKKPV